MGLWGNWPAHIEAVNDSGHGATAVSGSVSVIIPAHDAASTIGATLASLASARSLLAEILLVDDASEDGTADVASEVATELRLPLRILRVMARDAGVARNLGIDASTGQWLYFIDADDLHVAGGLDALLRKAQETPEIDLVAGAYRRKVDGRLCRIKRPARLEGVPDTNAYRYLCDRIRAFPVGSVLLSRRSAQKCRFPASIPYDEDTIFFATVLITARATSVSACVMIYHVSTERGNNRFAGQTHQYLQWRRALREMRPYGVPKAALQRRAGIVALKIARVHYARGDMQMAARFLVVAGAAPKSLPDRWRYLRYVMKVGFATWKDRLSGKPRRAVA
jgi:hypothetical protein